MVRVRPMRSAVWRTRRSDGWLVPVAKWSSSPAIRLRLRPSIFCAANIGRCLNTRSGVVGVLATARSLDGDLFRRTAARYGENIRVLTAVGEGFVELVEEDREQSPEAEEAVRRVLEPMIREGADQIVLGCTHYPFLLPVFRQVIGERGVAVVDPSPAVGRRVGQLLDQYDLRAEKGAAANYGFLTFADEAYRSRLECKAFG